MDPVATEGGASAGSWQRTSGNSQHDPVQRTRDLVTQAVRRQLVSDVPLGCFLSGGIDSSIIASAMRRELGEDGRLLTFSIGFEDPRYDETRYAAIVANHLNSEHQAFIVRPNAAEDLPRLAAMFGEPFGDSSALPTHYLSRETRRVAKVALSGDGGDELFGGYDRYRAIALSERMSRLPGAVLAMARLAGRLRGIHPKSPISRLKRLVATLHLPPSQRYAGYLRLFDEQGIVDLLGPDPSAAALARSSGQIVAERFETLHGPPLRAGGLTRDVVETALAVDREIYLPEDLLMKVDRCSMLHALEVRSPFMDHELVHFAAALPTRDLIKGGTKRLLREAFAEDLPEIVFNRPKMGFAIPIGQWFRTSLREMLHDSLGAADSFAALHFNMPAVQRLLREHQSNRRDHSQRLYALLMLELWWRAQRGHALENMSMYSA